jgi:hypothetical protein
MSFPNATMPMETLASLVFNIRKQTDIGRLEVTTDDSSTAGKTGSGS